MYNGGLKGASSGRLVVTSGASAGKGSLADVVVGVGGGGWLGGAVRVGVGASTGRICWVATFMCSLEQLGAGVAEPTGVVGRL